jgi:hypothetical protein
MAARNWSWKMIFLTVVSTAALALAAWAQDEEVESSCSAACYKAEEQCYETCSDAEDPAVCEENCQAQAEACLEACE